MEFDVFGTWMIVERSPNGWEVFYPAEEGKRRPVDWLVIPPDIGETEVARYLADLCHEGASPCAPTPILGR